jgi:hypothetical protein
MQAQADLAPILCLPTVGNFLLKRFRILEKKIILGII